MPDSSAHNARPQEPLFTADGMLEVVRHVVQDLRTAAIVEDVLNRIARAIAEAQLFQRAMLAVEDDRGSIIALGQYGVSEAVATAVRHVRQLQEKTREALLNPALKISESHLIPAKYWILPSRAGNLPEKRATPSDGDEWRPGSGLLTIIRDAGGKTIGHALVDTPFDGRRPDPETVRRLELLVHLGEEALARLHAGVLLDAESRFRRLVNNAEGALLLVSPERNAIDFVSPAVAELTGYSADFLMSQPLDALIRLVVHPADQKKMLAMWAGRRVEPVAVFTEPYGMELRLRRADGADRWVRQKSVPVKDNGGRVIAVESTLRDITQEHKLAEQLAESQRTCSLLAEHTRDLVYMRDLDGNFRWVSPSVGRFLDATPEEVANTHVSDWLTESAVDRAAFEAYNGEIGRGRTPPPLVLKMRSRTGRSCHLEITECLIRGERGTVLGIQGVGRDIAERRQAEEAQKRSEERYRELADLLPQTVFETDTEGNISFANRAGRAAFGYTEEEFKQGRHALEMVVPEDRARILQNMREILDGTVSAGNEYTALRKDGSTFPILIYSAPILQDGKSAGLRGVIVDLTERKRFEETLRRDHDLIRSLLDTAKSLIVCLDHEGRITIFNKELERVTGYSRHEVVGKPWPELFLPPEARHDGWHNFAQWIRRRPRDVYTGPLLTKSGEVRTILWSNSALLSTKDEELVALAVGQDITDRKRDEESLRASEARFRELVGLLPQGVFEIDLEGRLTFANRHARTVFDYTEEQFGLGQDVLQLFVPEDGVRIRESMQALLSGQETRRREYTGVRRGGSTFPVAVFSSLIRQSGQPVGFRGIILDLTDQQRAERALRESEARLRSIAENMPVLMDAFDNAGNIVAWNKECERVTGYSAAEIIGNSHAMELLYPDQEYRTRMQEEWARRGNDYYDWEWEITCKDGSVKTVAWSNISQRFPVPGWAIWGIGVDVTERRRAEERLRHSESTLKALFDAITDSVVLVDSDFRTLAANRAFGERLGIPAAGLIGKDLRDYFPPEIVISRTEYAEAALAAAQSMTVEDKRGEYVFLTTYYPMVGQGGTPTGLVVVGRDITQQKRAEDKLRESEKQYQELFNAIQEGIGIVDDTERVLFCNPGFARIYEEDTPERMIGHSVLEYVSKAERTLILEQTERRKRGESSQYELEIITGKGNHKTVLVCVSPRFDGSGRYVGAFGAVSDVTDRRRAMDALRDSEARFRTIAETIPVPVAVSRMSDGKMLYANALLASTFGYSAEELDAVEAGAFYADPDERRTVIEEFRSSGSIRSREVRARRADGGMFWMLLSLEQIVFEGEPAIFGGFIDVTERKEALEALRRSEMTERALLNATTESAMLINPDGRVLAINETAVRPLGGRVDDTLGRNIYDILSPAFAASLQLNVDRVVRTRQPVSFKDEFVGRLFDGVIHPLLDAGGEVERLAILARDVTERENTLRQLQRKGKEVDRANDALREMVAELHRKNRLYRTLMKQFENKNTELETTVFTLSHDLKAPLISIREQAARFRLRYAHLLDEHGQAMAQRISANAHNLLRLVDSLLDYARAHDYIGHIDHVDLEEVVEDVWELVSEAFPDREAKLHRPSGTLACRFSRLALERVLLNLLHNAVAYVPPERVPEIELRWSKTGERLAITVADNGRGIPEEERERVFSLFYRVQPAVGEGSGMGLAVVKRIVDSAGGTVAVAARPGEGTIFTVELPLEPESRPFE